MAIVGENKMKDGKKRPFKDGTNANAVWGLSRMRYIGSRLNSAFFSTFVLPTSTLVLLLQMRIILNKH